MDLDSISVHKHAKKKELGQYPAILTSHLVNNPYILPAWEANYRAGFSHFSGLAHLNYIHVTICDLYISFIGPNTYNENETIAKYEIMDGAPVRGVPNKLSTSCVMNI